MDRSIIAWPEDSFHRNTPQVPPRNRSKFESCRAGDRHSDSGRASRCPPPRPGCRTPQTPLQVVHRASWLQAHVHLPETVTTMYCWDAGDGVGAPAGCEGVGVAGSSVTYCFWLPGGCAWGWGLCNSVTYWGWGVAAVAGGWGGWGAAGGGGGWGGACGGWDGCGAACSSVTYAGVAMPTVGKMIINKAFFFSSLGRRRGGGKHKKKKKTKEGKTRINLQAEETGTVPGSLETRLGSSLT